MPKTAHEASLNSSRLFSGTDFAMSEALDDWIALAGTFNLVQKREKASLAILAGSLSAPSLRLLRSRWDPFLAALIL